MDAQTIVTPSGERLVLITEAAYKALLYASQASDGAHADAHARGLFSKFEALPESMAIRISNGENKIRVWREHRRLTARAVADDACITASMLCQIEKGRRTGTMEVRRRIAATLRVSLDDIT